jgi:D-glycero-alpha-D-manno-heptose 1-phosphate guanylyltransferase
MITTAIILAGGLGTRLRSAVPDLPKCMAPVAGKPFIFHVISYYQNQGIEKFIFSLGYKHEIIEEYLANNLTDLDYKVSIEEEPLGTGGAIYKACSPDVSEQVLILNGDTLFKVDLQSLFNFHISRNAECTLTLKPMKNTDRYGVVEIADHGQILSFKEKKYYESSLINGGVYALNTVLFRNRIFPEVFSFEKEYLEKYFAESDMFGIVQDKYFIDIGIPDDYQKAQTELAPNQT